MPRGSAEQQFGDVRPWNDDPPVDVESVPLQPRFPKQVGERLARPDPPGDERIEPPRVVSADAAAERAGQPLEGNAEHVA